MKMWTGHRNGGWHGDDAAVVVTATTVLMIDFVFACVQLHSCQSRWHL